MEKQPSLSEGSLKLRAELDRFAIAQDEHVYNEDWFDSRKIEAKENTELSSEMGLVLEQLVKLKSTNKNELAISCKTIGNECFQRKLYECATVAYSRGIAFYPSDRDLKASLYNNRSAAEFCLKNYRSSLKDCKMALKFNPNHQKASERAAQCRDILKLPEIDNPSNEKVSLCIANAFSVRSKEKPKKVSRAKEKMINDLLIHAVKDRNIQFESGRIDLKSLTPTDVSLKNHRVFFMQGRLIWPTYLIYVDFGQHCLIQQFDENDKFEDHIGVICDILSLNEDYCKYLSEHFLIYYWKGSNLFRFSPKKTLKEVLSSDSYVVAEGIPNFIVAMKGSKQELLLLAGYKTVNLD